MRPGIFKSQTTPSVIAERTTIAPTVPQRIALRCKCEGKLRAANAMTIALSPASTKSIKMIAARADHQGIENISMLAFPQSERD
jgi:hypothetical protein